MPMPPLPPSDAEFVPSASAPAPPNWRSLADTIGQFALPLQGVTLLAVEDSRFACEALRLMSMRAGARLRRAETLKEARAHLRVYRPDVVIIDLGLPDGRGEGLIRELATAANRPRVLLGTSGSADGRVTALAAGADGFLEKPLESLARFCEALQNSLPDLEAADWPDAPITPDPLALQDDLAHAARSLDAGPDRSAYATAFLQGVAHHAHDTALQRAADAAAAPKADLQALRRLVRRRLNIPAAGFFSKG
jgi:CheY-like chemotaxis protein